MEKYNGYDAIAEHYGRLTADVDYAGMAGVILAICKKYMGRYPRIAADLACGTGALARELAKCGAELIGIDISPQMLSEAKKQNTSTENEILYLMQDISEFELYGTVELITCCLDSINHLSGIRHLKKIMKLADNYLDPGGLFIFDIATAYRFEKIYSDNVYYEDSEELTCVWQNRYDKKTGTAVFDITLFIKQEDGRYIRKESRNFEKYFSEKDIIEAVFETSLKIVKKFGGFSMSRPSETSERILYILKKPENLFNSGDTC